MPGARFVLLHSPLIGPMAWQAVAAELTERGHAVTAPAWPQLSSIAGDFYETLGASLAATLSGGAPAILVAHSGAGPVIPALAEKLAPQAAGVIFVDALLPHPGRSWFDTAPPDLRDKLRDGATMGDLPPWGDWWPPGALARLIPDTTVLGPMLKELEPLPLAYFEEPAPVTALEGPIAYLQLSGAYDDEGQAAGRYGWPRVRLPLHHLAMLTQPEAVASALESLAARLEAPAHG